jgi:hypothetical protein
VNRVSIITNTAERQAAIEFAKAAATRPRIVGAGLQEITQDREIFQALFDILETQKIVEGEANITLIPRGNELLKQWVAAADAEPEKSKPGKGQ